MKKVILAALALAPAFVFAQDLSTLQQLVVSIGNIVDLAIPIVFSIALLAFFWGLVKYIFAQGDETAKVEGKKIMLWGLIALFVAASVWAIVIFAQDSLGLGGETTIPVPSVNQ